jgi:hypothetical protein
MEERAEQFVRGWVNRVVTTGPLGGLTTRTVAPDLSMISPHAINFLVEVIVEAVEDRLQEEQARKTFDFQSLSTPSPFAAQEVRRLIQDSQLERVIGSLLLDATPSGRNRQVLLVDLLETITRGWCGIWPFCKSQG